METIRIEGIEGEIPRVGLGTWAIGGWMWGGTGQREAHATILAALEQGLRLLDTAPVYGFGRSEEIVGRALAEFGAREKVVLATKAGLRWTEDGRITRDSSPKRLRREVEDSLRRLGTGYIDLYQVHWPDPRTDFEATAATLRALQEEGKIRAIGVSNYSPAQMEAFSRAAPLAACQPPYNLFERGIENDVLPWCKEHGVVMLGYGALCRGMLSGTMDQDRGFEGDDLRRHDPKFQEPRFSRYLEAAEKLKALASDRFDHSLLQMAVRWILDQGVEIALWGARRPDQLQPLPGVFGWHLSEEDRAAIHRIVDEAVGEPVGPEFMAPPA
jgi:aryl-alcohol dehydrogenase-like predicted oxidoreductase